MTIVILPKQDFPSVNQQTLHLRYIEEAKRNKSCAVREPPSPWSIFVRLCTGEWGGPASTLALALG